MLLLCHRVGVLVVLVVDLCAKPEVLICVD